MAEWHRGWIKIYKTKLSKTAERESSALPCRLHNGKGIGVVSDYPNVGVGYCVFMTVFMAAVEKNSPNTKMLMEFYMYRLD